MRETDFHEVFKVLCKVLSRFSAAGRAMLVNYYANFFPTVSEGVRTRTPAAARPTLQLLHIATRETALTPANLCLQERIERLVTALQSYLAVQWILRSDRQDVAATVSTVCCAARSCADADRVCLPPDVDPARGEQQAGAADPGAAAASRLWWCGRWLFHRFAW
mgnify:CR=1 FL=1